ncbi:MAG: hypothetical protein GXO48_08530 [Chlorobi bacterium]|nr:hypothetical protein [Chlorobiota bacterium]
MNDFKSEILKGILESQYREGVIAHIEHVFYLPTSVEYEITGQPVHTLVITSHDQQPYEGFIGKILLAVKQQHSSLVAYWQPEKPFSFIAFKRVFPTIKYVLVMGVHPSLIGINIDDPNKFAYKPFNLLDSVCLLSHKPSAIYKNRQLKAKLWENLKRIYNVS